MIIWFVWLVISLIFYAILTGFDVNNGIIPVNKNLWTPTYTFVSVTSGFGVLIILYFIIDYKKWWNGNPFIFTGTNSILVYTLHYVFVYTFPVQWRMPNFNITKFYMSIWGVTFWTAVAAYLFKKNIFFNF
jgi:heparan-alpha-glucosaminide N-acetyltransferase